MSIRVTINNQQRQTVRTIGVTPKPIDTIIELKDVTSLGQISNNYTLVYDSVLEKFVIREMTIITGGTF